MDMPNSITSALKTAALNFINPFTSDEKMVSVIAAFASKFILNFSFKYSCLIGFLTFGGLKIYQFGKNQQSDDILTKIASLQNYNIVFTPLQFPPVSTGQIPEIPRRDASTITKTDKTTGRNNIDDNRI